MISWLIINMDFELSINYLIADLCAIQRGKIENALENVGIHSGQVFILFELWKTDGLSQIEIARNLNLSAPTINKLVKGLKQTDFINMTRSENDTRVVNVFLTEKGKSVKTEIEEIWAGLDDQFTMNLTGTEKLIFAQLLDKVLQNFYNDKINT